MDVIEEPKRFGHHRNAFGLLRLLFASLVIVSHTPELIDGDRGRELLTRTFGTLSFGDLAVNGFFIISGLLISASFLASRSLWRYLLKRVARIWPAFLVASIVCVTIVAPLGGGDTHGMIARIVSAVVNSGLLRLPSSNYGAFAGSHYQGLNNASWTIAYEFRCYLLVAVLGMIGVLDRTVPLAILTAVSLAAAIVFPSDLTGRLNSQWHLHPGIWIGDIPQALRLTGMFLTGATFRSCQHRIALRPAAMAVGAVVLTATLFSPLTAAFGVAICGSYLIFGAAALGRGTVLERVNNRNDVSYGLYLYAWPIEKLLIAAGFGSSLVLLGALTWMGALAAGCVSWFLIERPVMSLVRPARRHLRSRTANMPPPDVLSAHAGTAAER